MHARSFHEACIGAPQTSSPRLRRAHRSHSGASSDGRSRWPQAHDPKSVDRDLYLCDPPNICVICVICGPSISVLSVALECRRLEV